MCIWKLVYCLKAKRHCFHIKAAAFNKTAGRNFHQSIVKTGHHRENKNNKKNSKKNKKISGLLTTQTDINRCSTKRKACVLSTSECRLHCLIQLCISSIIHYSAHRHRLKEDINHAQGLHLEITRTRSVFKMQRSQVKIDLGWYSGEEFVDVW